ncbi:MAG: YraN family protein [Clostridia bacterium]|nr:YraN family protein [Clostridia bacterium]
MREYTKQEIGRRGERTAARFLRRSGFRLVARNCHFGKQELDLVVKDKQHIVFVEVKTRTFLGEKLPLSRPADAVDRAKRVHTVMAAMAFLKEYKTSLAPRFDVVEVYLDREKRLRPVKINHIPDAFGANANIRR